MPANPQQGPMLAGAALRHMKTIEPGEAIPEEWGGGVNKWPWPIPLIAAKHGDQAGTGGSLCGGGAGFRPASCRTRFEWRSFSGT